MRIMLDTNVLISALVFGGKTREVFLRLLNTEHEMLVSEYVANEFEAKIRQKWQDKASDILKAFEKLPVSFCKSSEILQGQLRDKKDIPVLSDALYNNVDVILTGDKDFLDAELEKPIIFSVSMIEEYFFGNK